MIVTKTPVRISLGAGATDLPEYYNSFGAQFLTSSGSKYVHVMVNHHPEKVVWMGLNVAERVDSPSQLKHRVVGKVLEWLGITKNIEVVSIADVLPNSGLGTSSSFVVGLLNGLHAYKGEYLWPEELAEEACHVEQIMLGEHVGKQDQYAAALGGLIWVEIQKDGSTTASRFKLRHDFIEELENHLAFFDTGMTRNSSEVQDNVRRVVKTKIETFHSISKLALDIRRALERQDLKEFGGLLDLHWQYKRQLTNEISNDVISTGYKIAKESGAIGGNLMGAGGGGCFMFVCNDSTSSAEIRKNLMGLGWSVVDMHFEERGSIRISV